ncbi:MAG: hypothetical protein FD146_133 [Anaerolineaceae bacterium]|nr:MAG: hypothetical protein FD146_133 [Anaerolineaceae bacterium]
MRTRLAAILLLFILLASCAQPTATPVGPTSAPVPTAAPTVTGTPGIPLVILVLPADMPRDESGQYQTAVYDLAQANGMRYQLLNTLTTADITLAGPDLKIVIVLPPDPGLAALAAEAPSVQFLAVSIPGLAAAPNISTIGAEGAPVDQQAFMAGYIAAMIADDYRIGMIGIRDDAKSDLAETAFRNGIRFYCGLCQKAFWTGYDYPVFNNIPTDTPLTQYPAYAIYLEQTAVSVAYVYPAVATPDLLFSLTDKDMLLIGEKMPSPDFQANWVVSLKPELFPAIQRIFPDLLAGRGGQTLGVPLTLTDVNTDLLSEGKLRLVQQTLDDLQAGYIGTGVNP